jgi:hypothetical protein
MTDQSTSSDWPGASSTVRSSVCFGDSHTRTTCVPGAMPSIEKRPSASVTACHGVSTTSRLARMCSCTSQKSCTAPGLSITTGSGSSPLRKRPRSNRFAGE